MEQTGSYLVFTWDYAAQGGHSSACSGPQSSGLRYQRPADFAQKWMQSVRFLWSAR